MMHKQYFQLAAHDLELLMRVYTYSRSRLSTFKAKLAYTEARSDRRPKGFNLKAQENFVSWT